MKTFDDEKYFEVFELLNSEVPYKSTNICISVGVARGEKITRYKLMKLLSNESGHNISPKFACMLYRKYVKLIDKLNSYNK